MLVLGIGLNIGRKLQVRKQLLELEQATRPQATVIRESQVRSIDNSQVVKGDILVVGPGDQFLADGQILGEARIVVDESMLIGDPKQRVRQAGDVVYAGSVCVAGHEAYEAQKVGDEHPIVLLTGRSPAMGDRLPPLERLLGRILRVMLVVVALLSVLLLINPSFVPDAQARVDVP